jgi:hypothetical protein
MTVMDRILSYGVDVCDQGACALNDGCSVSTMVVAQLFDPGDGTRYSERSAERPAPADVVDAAQPEFRYGSEATSSERTTREGGFRGGPEGQVSPSDPRC